MMKKIRFFILFLMSVVVSASSLIFATNSQNIKDSLKTTATQNKAARDSLTQKATATAQSSSSEVGITMNADCMGGVGCSFSIYDAMGIRKDRAPAERTSVMVFLQDIVLGATWFIGTVVAVAFILSGVFYVFSGADSTYKKKAKEGMKYSIYGIIIVMLAIVIVRVVQFIARGGS